LSGTCRKAAETSYSFPGPSIGQVSVSHRHGRVGMTETCLCSSQVAQADLDVVGERIPKVVEAEPGDIRLLEAVLQARLTLT